MSKKMKNRMSKKEIKYKGLKNQTDFPEFINICKKTQEELIDYLPKKLLEEGYKEVVVEKGYIYAKGTVPVLLTAHMDTVHEKIVVDYYEWVDDKGKHVITSPQGIGGDDRCGIYMILEIIKEHKCSVLFCEDEEVGGVGSELFCASDFFAELYDLNYLIELDRANCKDAVFYDCDNEEFTEFITKETGYTVAYGSFSDISVLAPKCGVAAVNLSCGYYNAHKLEEEVIVEDMINTIEVVKKLLLVESKQYKYIEAYNDFYSYKRDYGYSRLDYMENYSGCILYVTWIDQKGKTLSDQIYADSQNEAWVNFFMENSKVCFDDVIDFDYDYDYF